MNGWLAVALGGGLGALLRYTVSMAVGTHHLFPWATLGINIAGSLAIGLVWGACEHSAWFQAWGRLFLVVGLLGGFTTFSAFSLESLLLLEQSRMGLLGAYIASSFLMCVLACYLGLRLGANLS